MAYKTNGSPSTKAARTVAHKHGQRTDNRLPTKHKISRPSAIAAHTEAYEYGQREDGLPTKDKIDPYIDPYAYERSSHSVLTCGSCKEPFANELYAERIDPRGGYVWEGQVNVQKQLDYLRWQQEFMDEPSIVLNGRTLCLPCCEKYDRWVNSSHHAEPGYWTHELLSTV